MPLCAPPFVPGRRDPSPAALSNTGHLHLPFGMAKILLHSTPAPRKEKEQLSSLSSLSSILFFSLCSAQQDPEQLWTPSFGSPEDAGGVPSPLPWVTSRQHCPKPSRILRNPS